MAATPSAGTYTAITAGDGHTCGLTTEAIYQCWGARAVRGWLHPV